MASAALRRWRAGHAIWIATGIAIVLAALYGFYWQYRQAEAAKAQLGLDATRTLSEVFLQTSELRVSTLTGEVQAWSTDDGLLFDTEQTTKAPYRVSYFVRLGAMRAGDYRWDAESSTMTVTIPDVVAEPPGIDMSRAMVEQRGVWITRRANAALQRQAHERLSGRATATANSPENIDKARAAAVAAVERMVAQPLAAARMSDVKVQVEGAWRTPRDQSRQDVSRPIDEVLRDAR